ncbi:MAG: glycoside hydrolase family 13 protein [Anaerolineaceae bacterium]|nr:MAG: glycoside hydrolase family 13 protein [Anaerolineaceae bacterium]
MVIEHDSRNILYRSPFGAVPCMTNIRLRLYVKADKIPASITLVYRYRDDDPVTLPMNYIYMIARGSIYEAELQVPKDPGLIFYYFTIVIGNNTYYYGNNKDNLGGLGKVSIKIPPGYQITVYRKDFKTPDWFKGSIIYQIFPDRFYKGEMDSFKAGRDDIIRRDWDDVPYYKAEQFGGEYLANDFYGGNLDGIMRKLPYLRDLGISVVYLNPIFKAYSNHKYDTGDYEEIDPMFGSNELFEELCRKALGYGIRIILDGVFNHTGSDSKYFNKEGSYEAVGAYQSKDSPYYNWYRFSKHPEEYESWWDFKTLPNINETEPSYVDYIITSSDSIVKKWLNYGAYGWRLDVADELPSELIKMIRKEMKSTKPESVLIGEVWEDASNKVSYGVRREYFLGEELDSVMNYPLRNAIIDFACQSCDANTFGMRIMSLCENYPSEAFYSLMNLLSSHDSERILTMLGDAPDRNKISKDEMAVYKLSELKSELAKKRLENVVLLQMTLPGVPCIYYGDEVGMQGYNDPFNRKAYPWGSEDGQILSIYKKMIAFRQENSLLIEGDFEIIYMYKSCLAFARYDKEKLILVSVNMDKKDEVFVRLDLSRFHPTYASDMITSESLDIINGTIIYDLPPLSYKIIEADIKEP